MSLNKILITGATGRLGANVVKQALDNGYQVRALRIPNDPKSFKLNAFDIEVVVGDLRDAKLCYQLLEGVEGVIHTANILGPPGGMSDAEFFDTNVKGTFNLLWAAGQRANDLARVVHVSSDGIYPSGDLKIGPDYYPVDELHTKRPVGLYSLSKHLNEVTLEGIVRTTGLRTATIRPAGMFAGDELLGRWTVNFVAQRIRGGGNHPGGPMYHPEAAKIADDLLQRADNQNQWCSVKDAEGCPWVYQPSDARDVAAACLCVLEHPAAVGEAFNMAVPQPFTFPEVAAFLQERTGQAAFEIEVPVRFEYRIDLRKSKSLLGFEPRCNLEVAFGTALDMREGKETDCVPA